MEQKVVPEKTERQKKLALIPQDVVEIFSFLQEMKSDFSDSFSCEIDEPMSELRADIKAWLSGEDDREPSWDSFRMSIDDACSADGMPRLFGVS